MFSKTIKLLPYLILGYLSAVFLLERIPIGPHYIHVCNGGMDEVSERGARKQ